MYLAIIILPLIGSIVSGFFGRKLGVYGSQAVACTAVLLSTIFAILTFFEVGFNNASVFIEGFRWIDSESLNVEWAFNYDSLTVSMLIPVLIVSSLVHIYSIGYMSEDPHIQRFFSYLSLFTFMMVILVSSNNYLLMFVGWEGVGVCSYLLVCFWFTRLAANMSALSAFLTNRVGDMFLTIGMFAIIWCFGNLDYATVFSLAPYMNENLITIIGICLLIGAMAKSSQLGLHVWLPMAMEGPTPVSALIHAATMVTAGVYLLIRSSPLIEYSSTVLMICLWLGAITTVFSSVIGLFQQDIKKVIAYSTMSQLGMMVIAVGLSCYNIALFHLINHAFYKALLFLAAGAVIHSVYDNQDFRKYGGLTAFLPLTYTVIFVASLSLVAFPFMTGFYSKDLILEAAFGGYGYSDTVVYFIAIIAAAFTSLYSVKVLYLTFLTNPNGPLINYQKLDKGDIFINLPLIILAVFSIFFGFLTKDIFIGLGSAFFSDNALFIHPSHEIQIDTEFAVPTLFKLLPLILTLSLFVTFIVVSEYFSKWLIYFKLSRLGYNIFSFFNKRFFIELFYNKFITGLILKLGGQTTKVLDKGSVEYVGPYGLKITLLNLSNKLAGLSTGITTSYALYIVVGLVSFLSLTIDLIFANISLILFFSIYLYSNGAFAVIKVENHLTSRIQLKAILTICMQYLRNLFNYQFLKKIFIIFSVGLITRIFVNYIYEIDVFKDYIHIISLYYYAFIASFTGVYNNLPNIRALNSKLFKDLIAIFSQQSVFDQAKDKMGVGNDLDIKNCSRDNDDLVLKKNGGESSSSNIDQSISKGNIYQSSSKAKIGQSSSKAKIGQSFPKSQISQSVSKGDTVFSKTLYTGRITVHKEGSCEWNYKKDLKYRRDINQLANKPAAFRWLKSSSPEERSMLNTISRVRKDMYLTEYLEQKYSTSNDKVNLCRDYLNIPRNQRFRDLVKCRCLWPLVKLSSNKFSSCQQYADSFDRDFDVSIKDELKKIFKKK